MTDDVDRPRYPQPMQPVAVATDGVLRFQRNRIVEWLLQRSDMNEIAEQGFAREDHEQFAQLIEYSVSGFGDLSYTSDLVYDEAARRGRALLERREIQPMSDHGWESMPGGESFPRGTRLRVASGWVHMFTAQDQWGAAGLRAGRAGRGGS